MDVDDESDLRELLQRDLAGTATGAFLEKTGIVTKLRADPNAAARLASQT